MNHSGQIIPVVSLPHSHPNQLITLPSRVVNPIDYRLQQLALTLLEIKAPQK
jgi:hypothetical protein